MLDPECRLLTLVGFGGSGKTTLALAVANSLVAPASIAEDHPFADGIFRVDCRSISIPGPDAEVEDTIERRIVTAIGLSIGLVFYGDLDRLDQVAAYLQPKRSLLLLDNLEHLAGGAAALTRLLDRAPGITILVTSRVPLGAPEEWLIRVGGLQLPQGVVDLEQAPASQFFLREARRADVQVAEPDAPHVVRICSLTGGLPLALKIAAGWLHVLSIEDIVHQLETGGSLLADEVSIEGDRQVSIRGLLDSVWLSLPSRERRALRRLAIFPGHFEQSVAEAIGVSLPDLLALSRRSLVDREPDGRYLLHPLVRLYGADLLAQRPDEDPEVHQLHAGYYARFVAPEFPRLFQRPESHALMADQLSSIRVAWTWAVESLDLILLADLVDGMAVWHLQSGLHREWCDALEGAINRVRAATQVQAGPELFAMLGRLLLAEADALHWQGEMSRSYASQSGAWDCVRLAEDDELAARFKHSRGRTLHFDGDPIAALEMLEQAGSLARIVQAPRVEAESLLAGSFILADLGRYADSKTLLLQAEDSFRTLGDRLSQLRTKLHSARLRAALGDFSNAKIDLERCLVLAGSFVNRPVEGWIHLYLGFVCDTGFGRHREAGEHFQRAHRAVEDASDVHFAGSLLGAEGRNALHVGEFARAGALLSHSLDFAVQSGTPSSLTRAHHGLGQLALQFGDLAGAESRARHAVNHANDSGRQFELAQALILLGQVQEQLLLRSEATASYQRASEIAEAIGMPYLGCEASTGLASVELASGDPHRAASLAVESLRYLREQSLAGCDQPEWVAQACWRALSAAGDPNAQVALQYGAELLEQRAAGLPAFQRERYFSAYPARVSLVSHWREFDPEPIAIGQDRFVRRHSSR